VSIYSLLLVTESAESEKVIEGVAAKVGLADLPIYSGAMKSILEGDLKEQPDIILVDVAQTHPPDANTVQKLMEKCPHSRIAFLGVPASGELVVQLSILGVRDFLTWPVVSDQFLNLTTKPLTPTAQVAPTAPAQAGTNLKTITIIAAKGGSGATLVAANVGVALAQRYPNKVLVIDIASQCGDLCTYLDLVPK
jgi:pilus assembly protein CpaE